jgi:hypothetical protein
VEWARDIPGTAADPLPGSGRGREARRGLLGIVHPGARQSVGQIVPLCHYVTLRAVSEFSAIPDIALNLETGTTYCVFEKLALNLQWWAHEQRKRE